jgi:hypothetical protein
MTPVVARGRGTQALQHSILKMKTEIQLQQLLPVEQRVNLVMILVVHLLLQMLVLDVSHVPILVARRHPQN